MLFVRYARQWWKLGVGFSVIGAAAVFVALSGVYRGEFTDDAYYAVLSTGYMAIGGALAWMCMAVSCPRCGYRLFWQALIGRTGPKLVLSLLEMRECPGCGFGGLHDNYRIIR